MDFDSLKSNWKNTGDGIKDQKELLMMTKMKNHDNLKRIKIKLIIEAVLVTFFLAVYYEAFDGDNKPLWSNLLLIIATCSYLLVRYIGWIVLRNPINGENIKTSLIVFQNKLHKTAYFNLITSFLFGVTLITFFVSSIDLTEMKYFMVIGMVLTLIVFVYFSSRLWFKRVKRISNALKGLNESLN